MYKNNKTSGALTLERSHRAETKAVGLAHVWNIYLHAHSVKQIDTGGCSQAQKHASVYL